MRTQSTDKQAQEFGKALGRAIALQRKAQGLTQDDLAGLVQVDTESISRFERGSVMPSLARLVQIATALQIGMTDLLSNTSPLAKDQEQQFAHLVHSLRDEDRRLLRDFAELLKQRS